ncbi:MAG TPA: hypothetical protein PLD25_13275 [Chloroflexota bacterium]|nr:hypothetical protein [Chloroflexota bacterium]HUM71675.1 hypothetical protein [Chloroflexota bacterium]
MLPVRTILESAQIVLDSQGNRTAIQLDWQMWEQLQSLLEDLEDAAEIEMARQEEDDLFDWEQVVADYQAQHAVNSDV